MSTTTTNYGLIKPGTDDPILVGQLNDNMDTIDTVLKDHSDKIDAAALGIKYKGEVNYYADLPNNAEIGDAYTVKYAGSSGTTPDGTEYVWGTVSGTNQWINFSKDSYTKAEVDALLALKVDTAGTGLSKSGTTLNHSNSTTAKTTQGFAQISYDAQGHITGSTAATTAQANAINSGIDSAKVEQIETNKNNISYNTNNGVKNVVNFNTNLPTTTIKGITFTDNHNGTINVNGTSTDADAYVQLYNVNSDNLFGFKIGETVVITSTSNTVTLQIIPKRAGGYGATVFGTKSSPAIYTIPSNFTGFLLRVGVVDNGTHVDNENVGGMICLKSLYDADPTYQPPAMSNAELTAKEQVNENNILSLLPTAYTKPTRDTGIFLQSGGYCKIGNVCVVCLRFSDSSAVAANTAIFSGLPLPVKDSTIPAGRILIPVANSKNIEINVTSSGEIKLGGTALSGANDIITAFAVYLAQS